MGRLAILCCNKLPNEAAHIRRNTIFSREKKVILFLTKDHLKEMLFIKERGEESAKINLRALVSIDLNHSLFKVRVSSRTLRRPLFPPRTIGSL